LKRPLVIGALSAIMLALFTLPSLADPVVPAEGEAPPVPPETQPLPAEDEPPATTADACPAQALDPTSCQGLPETPPYDCSTGVESAQGPELCESGSTQDLQTVELAALMAATDAVADAAANSSSGTVAPPAAYAAALDAAKEAAREAGAGEETAGTVAEAAAQIAAMGSLGEEAAEEATAEDGSSAVDGAAAYLAALSAAREAGAEEEPAPTAAVRAGATDKAPESGEAGTSGDQTSVSENRASPAKAEVATAAEDEAPDRGEATPANDYGAGKVAADVGPSVQGIPPLVFEGGALLVTVGVVGLLVLRRRLVL
jgi:colicin import membrane protein